MKDLNTVKGYNWGTGVIELELGDFAMEFRPVEIHIKEDGSLDNKPSMCVVMVRSGVRDLYSYGQLSLEMWNKALGEIGYKIEKI